MRKLVAAALLLVFSAATLPVVVLAQPPTIKTGGIRGTALDPGKRAMPRVNVQVRGADGTLVSSGTTNSLGHFSFGGLNPGNYTLEILDAAGNIVGTSASVAVTAGATAVVTVSAAAIGAIAAAGAGGISLFGLGTIGTVAVVAGAAVLTTAAVVATRGESSGSR